MPPPHNSAASKHLSAAKDAAAHVGKEAGKGSAAVPPASNAPFWQVCLARCVVFVRWLVLFYPAWRRSSHCLLLCAPLAGYLGLQTAC